MRIILYRVWQCSWGLLQTLLGFAVYLIHIRDPHFSYHGAIVTKWKNPASVSLGMFLFVAQEPYFFQRFRKQYTKEELSERLLVHEFGHTVQSLILGPLY